MRATFLAHRILFDLSPERIYVTYKAVSFVIIVCVMLESAATRLQIPFNLGPMKVMLKQQLFHPYKKFRNFSQALSLCPLCFVANQNSAGM